MKFGTDMIRTGCGYPPGSKIGGGSSVASTQLNGPVKGKSTVDARVHSG